MRLIILLLGCAAVDPDFAGDRANAICAWHARCDGLEIAGFDTEDACRAALREAADTLDPSTCAHWDEAAAAACLEAYATTACDVPPDLSACLAVCGVTSSG